MRRIAFITGATSGIGEAVAQRLAADHFDLIITGRRGDRLNALAEKLTADCGVAILPLCFDVRDSQQVEAYVDGLPERWQAVDVLVNNAGLAVELKPVHDGLLDDWERMIDTNLKGLLYVTRRVAPYMITRRRGHIINIGSIAGREVYAGGNVYCATKYAVDALTKGLRMELLPYGIRVSQVAPGAVATSFSLVRFKGDRRRADNVYEGYEPLCAADIADVVAYMVGCPPHVNIADVLVLPAAQASASLFEKERDG
ncbi:MAG: SDR family NAD(P)-dependent oxidoreductase [Prevotellaceae bacterium]|jgi:NADP-dependent 3-hydroxy acid dehydrogenase YdfG|nr:SDR family NAD(P)-dependent oxidoreductase [Prevotellaceae bacterium]